MSDVILDTRAEHTLVDLASFRPEGRSVLFVRPRFALSVEAFKALAHSVGSLPIPGVMVITVPHDIELMALTEGELEKIGYARIPAPVERLVDGELRRFTSEQCADDFEARVSQRTAP